METKYEQVLPDPERVIEGLRDTGYQFETAIEDIMDNSIAAEATFIDVKIEMDFAGEISVYIADNGYGMNYEDLKDAMRYGSKRRPDPASLGKFGLGLKTASTAFCRQLSVISRNAETSQFSKATWDLDHVALVGDWELIVSTPSEEELEHISAITSGGAGTLVVWNKVDRLLKAYLEPGGRHARQALDKIVGTLEDHVGMTYQRYLDKSDSRDRNVEIRINGERVEAWNPFCPEESEVIAREEVEVEDPDTGEKAFFAVQAFILPRKEEFSSEEAWKRSKLGNDTQGIYVYRQNRMIYGPDWLRMYSKEPHQSLLRVEFSFDYRLDGAFHIDIKKSQIILNESLREWLKDVFLPVCRRAAEQRYRKGLKKDASKVAKELHDSSNKNIRDKADKVSESKVESLDSEKNEVELTNKHGTTRLKIKIMSAKKPGEVYVQPVSEIEDGLLWEPVIIEGNKGVQINTGHEYYSKVYVPNRSSGVTIQGLDSLLWSLCEAELGTVNEQTQKYFEEMRREVSRILRKLVEDLPEPKVNNDGD